MDTFFNFIARKYDIFKIVVDLHFNEVPKPNSIFSIPESEMIGYFL
jgi:hypothetical protein